MDDSFQVEHPSLERLLTPPCDASVEKGAPHSRRSSSDRALTSNGRNRQVPGMATSSVIALRRR